MKISLIITSYREPNLAKAVAAALNQKTKYNYEVIVVAPEKINYTGVKYIQDKGKGKSAALNQVLQEVESNILIFTDGDVTISENAVEEIVNEFSRHKVGCVTGRPIPVEDKTTKYGYWANVLFNAAHQLRNKAYVDNDFIECSGYLFAFRGGIIKDIPLDVAEDAYIPYYFANRGFKIAYAEKAEVYVKNVDNFDDWLLQKVRTAKAHETLDSYVDTESVKKVKSITTEAKGLFGVLGYASSIKELYWTTQLILARGWMWVRVKTDRDRYSDNWVTPESTK